MKPTMKTNGAIWGLMVMTIVVVISMVVAACGGTSAPQVVKETVVVEGTTQVVEKEVTKVVEVVVTATPEPAPPVEQKLTIAVDQLAERLDATMASRHSWRSEFLIYDPIVRMGADGHPAPALATSWQALDDTTWEFKLREGVQFHNGEEFDAEAVKFTIEFLQNPDTKSNYARNISMIAEVQVVDKYTVRIITDGPQAVLVANLAGVLVLPPKHFADVGREAFNAAPVGTGPYKLVEFSVNERIILKRNEDYWGDPHRIDTVVFVEMPEASTRMAALEAGEVDIIDRLAVDQVARLEAAGLKVEPITEAQTILLLLETPLQREQFPFLSDRRVRQALNYAVNKQELADALTGGYGRPAMGALVGPDGFGYDPNLSMYEYDPDKARQLLAAAGHPDGFSFPMYYPIQRQPYMDEIVPVVASYLAEIGVTMEVIGMENAAWVEKYLAVELPTTAIGVNYDPTMDADRVVFFCYSEFPRKWVAGDPEFDALFKQERSLLDAEERLPVLQAAVRKCAGMAPVIYTIFPPSIYAYSPRVQNLHFRADAKYDLAGVYLK